MQISRLIDASTAAAANTSIVVNVPLHDGAMRIGLETINDDFLDKHITSFDAETRLLPPRLLLLDHFNQSLPDPPYQED